MSCLWASSYLCSHSPSYWHITKHSQISWTPSFQRQQFPRIFLGRQPATGGRAVSSRSSWSREAAQSHPWPGSRSPGCFFPVQEPHQLAHALSWAPAQHHKMQSCRKPGFTHSGSGLWRSMSWPACKHTVGMFLYRRACQWQELLKAHITWVSTATETISSSRAWGLVSYCCWPNAQARRMPECFWEWNYPAVPTSCGSWSF